MTFLWTDILDCSSVVKVVIFGISGHDRTVLFFMQSKSRTYWLRWIPCLIRLGILPHFTTTRLRHLLHQEVFSSNRWYPLGVFGPNCPRDSLRGATQWGASLRTTHLQELFFSFYFFNANRKSWCLHSSHFTWVFRYDGCWYWIDSCAWPVNVKHKCGPITINLVPFYAGTVPTLMWSLKTSVPAVHWQKRILPPSCSKKGGTSSFQF